MIEVESAPAASKKRNVVFWPSVVMLVMVFVFWVYLYDELRSLLLWLIIEFFAAICLISFVCLIVLRRFRKSLSFFVPILLAATMGWWFIPVPAMRPVSTPFQYSRDYVEFLIYAAKHHIREDVRQNGLKYKRWHLRTDLWDDYYIVFDVTDGIVKKDRTRLYDDPMADPGCSVRVFSVGNHFYLVKEGCPPRS